jgi:hypothetical protein
MKGTKERISWPLKILNGKIHRCRTSKLIVIELSRRCKKWKISRGVIKRFELPKQHWSFRSFAKSSRRSLFAWWLTRLLLRLVALPIRKLKINWAEPKNCLLTIHWWANSLSNWLSEPTLFSRFHHIPSRKRLRPFLECH